MNTIESGRLDVDHDIRTLCDGDLDAVSGARVDLGRLAPAIARQHAIDQLPPMKIWHTLLKQYGLE